MAGDGRRLRYGRAIVNAGVVNVSQSAGLPASPSGFSTLSWRRYVPLGTTFVLSLPLSWPRVPSHANVKNPGPPVAVGWFRGRYEHLAATLNTGWTNEPSAFSTRTATSRAGRFSW